MKKVLLIAFFTALLAGCDRQRDLYIRASPLLYIEGDWVPSLGISDMSQKATAMLYNQSSPAVLKEFFYLPDHVTAQVSNGEYGILIFNGLMFSEDDTNLDQIYFRNTDRAETFEAFVAEAAPSRRLVRAGDEYLASNDMEILTSAYTEEQIDGERGYYVKYHNGHDDHPVAEDYVESEIRMTPRQLSYYTQVVVHLVNPGSAAVSNGALRGFSGSVFMASGIPSHESVTHQLRLNNLHIDPGSQPETGTIESPIFVTFGPPLDLSEDDGSWKYEFEISIILKDGSVLEKTFDVAPQVLPVIERIKNNTLQNSLSQPILIEIGVGIETRIELPVVESTIGINDWEDNEIIRVPIRE